MEYINYRTMPSPIDQVSLCSCSYFCLGGHGMKTEMTTRSQGSTAQPSCIASTYHPIKSSIHLSIRPFIHLVPSPPLHQPFPSPSSSVRQSDDDAGIYVDLINTALVAVYT